MSDVKHNPKVTMVQNSRFHNLGVSVDYKDDPKIDGSVCLFFTPFMDEPTNHYHIGLPDEASLILYKWLGDYFKDKEIL